MERPITGFRLDEEGDWVAILGCGHLQHVRHNPPFVRRPWVTTEAGRQRTLGRMLNCVRCDRLELPAAAVPGARTEHALAGAAAPAIDDRAAPGVWHVIVVHAGRLRLQIEAVHIDALLAPGASGVVPPELAYRLEPLEPARFAIERHAVPAGAA
jgi:tellurite methyltransferase